MLATVATVEVLDFFSKGSAGCAALFMLHQTAEPSVFVLMVLRLSARMATQVPPPVSSTPLIQFTTRFTHGALYALMVGMPLLGLLALIWGGRPIQPLRPDLSSAVIQGKTSARSIKGMHESGATLAYIAAGLHVAATLWHELILKDRLLRRMIQHTRKLRQQEAQ